MLKCVNGKYYVGITTKEPHIRFLEHKRNVRSAGWTRKHKPLVLFYSKFLGNITKAEAQLFEARATRRYIIKYGIDNVRGGDITRTDVYLKRFGRFFPKDEWESIAVILMLLLVIVMLVMDKYLRGTTG